jgi:hypothetical protein
MTPAELLLSPRQQAALAEISEELAAHTARDSAPATDDEVVLAALDSWIAGVLSSGGGIRAASLRDLLEQQRDAE